MVERIGMAEPRAGTHLRQEIGRVGHALHPAGNHDPGVSKRDLVERDHRRLHARAAHLVERRRGHLRAEVGLEARLACGRLALAGGQDAAHQQFLDLAGCRAGIGQGGGDGRTAERRGIDFGEGALEAAHRGPRGAGNHNIFHLKLLPIGSPRGIPNSKDWRLAFA